MKITNTIRIVTTMTFGFLVNPNMQAGTNDIFRARLLLRGAFQDTNDVTQTEKIGRVILGTKDLVNLALGQSTTNTPPSTYVLAMMRDSDDHDRTLIVYDTQTHSNLATIAGIDGEGRVRGAGRAVFIWDIEWMTSGTDSNGIQNGQLCIAGQRVRTNSTFLITGKTIGTIDLSHNGRSFHVIIPDGLLTIKGPSIGSVIEAP